MIKFNKLFTYLFLINYFLLWELVSISIFTIKNIIKLEVKTDTSEDNDNNSDKNNIKNMTQYTDFIFIIREKKDEKDDNNLIVKNIYTGYIGIINVTLKMENKII